jgi:hypothetical protein
MMCWVKARMGAGPVGFSVTEPEGAAAADAFTGFHKEGGPTSNIGGSGPVTDALSTM